MWSLERKSSPIKCHLMNNAQKSSIRRSLTSTRWNNDIVSLNRFYRCNWISRRNNILESSSSRLHNFVSEKLILVVWNDLLFSPAYQNLKSTCHEYSTWIDVAILQIMTIFVCNVLSKSFTNTIGIYHIFHSNQCTVCKSISYINI